MAITLFSMCVFIKFKRLIKIIINYYNLTLSHSHIHQTCSHNILIKCTSKNFSHLKSIKKNPSDLCKGSLDPIVGRT